MVEGPSQHRSVQHTSVQHRSPEGVLLLDDVRLVDELWADPVAAQRDWEHDLAALYAELEEDGRREAAARRALLDGVPGSSGVAAVEEVLAGGQAGVQDEVGDELVSAFAAAHRLAAYGLWLELATTARLLAVRSGRTPSLPRTTRSGRVVKDDDDALVEDDVANEVALAAGVTFATAASRVEAAKALIVDGLLPATADLLRQGFLDGARVQTLVGRTRDLTAEQIRAVEARVFATRGVLEFGITRFGATVDRAVEAVDAGAAEARRSRNRRDRRVGIQATPDGSASFSATGPGEAIVAAYNGLDAAARQLRAGGDPRTLDQLRHDLFVTGCTTGSLPVPADLLPVPAGCVRAQHPDNDHPGGTGSTPSGGTNSTAPSSANSDDSVVPPWFTTMWPDVQPHLAVTVSAETLLGLTDEPGELDGYGPLSAAAVRDLAANATYRCLVVDGEHGTVLGVGRSTFTPGYTPGEKLKAYLEHAAPVCDVPGCGVKAWRCDLDHVTPYVHGGATCECNIRPLCRRHHRLKTAGLLTITPSTDPDDPPGTRRYTTRTGRGYTALPHVPLPRDGLGTTIADRTDDTCGPAAVLAVFRT